MNVREAVAVAKQHLGGLYAGMPADAFRLDEFLYDDHLGVWSLTLGLTIPDRPRDYKIVRVSEADKSILSVRDR